MRNTLAGFFRFDQTGAIFSYGFIIQEQMVPIIRYRGVMALQLTLRN